MNDILKELDSQRIREYEELIFLIHEAGRLNHGSNITGRIKMMEDIHVKLTHTDMDKPRKSFLAWLHDVMIHLREQQP